MERPPPPPNPCPGAEVTTNASVGWFVHPSAPESNAYTTAARASGHDSKAAITSRAIIASVRAARRIGASIPIAIGLSPVPVARRSDTSSDVVSRQGLEFRRHCGASTRAPLEIAIGAPSRGARGESSIAGNAARAVRSDANPCPERAFRPDDYNSPMARAKTRPPRHPRSPIARPALPPTPPRQPLSLPARGRRGRRPAGT